MTPDLLVWSNLIDAMDFGGRPEAERFYRQLQRFILTLEPAELEPLYGYYEALDTDTHMHATIFLCAVAEHIPDVVIKQTFIQMRFGG